VPARKVNDREPTESETERSGDVVTVIVGPTMDDGSGHRLDVASLNRGLASEVILSANSAHGVPQFAVFELTIWAEPRTMPSWGLSN
jgi:hypothetical protein